MKRIFIIQNTPINAPLPLSIYLTDLLRNTKKIDDLEINLIISKSKSIPKEIRRLCNKIYQLDSSTYSIKDNLKFSFNVKMILDRENKINKIDILHCFYPNSSLLGGVIFKLLKNKNVNIIYDIRSPWIDMSIERGFVSEKVSNIYRYILYGEEKFLCKFVDCFIFITYGLKDYYNKKIKINKNKKIYVSPSGIDLKLFKKTKSNIREKYNLKSDNIIIGSVGGIAKIRKLDEFIYLFKELVSYNKNIKLMFVGEGDALSDLKKLTNKLKLNKYIIFTGKIEHKEIPKYISTFNFGLCHLPNIFIYENSFPLKILEYLACGIPVLASELKAHSEISKSLEGVFIYHNFKDILKILSKDKLEINNILKIRKYGWLYLSNKYKSVWDINCV